MTFDGTLFESPLARRQRLIEALSQPIEALSQPMPEGFVWDYSCCSSCAMGLAVGLVLLIHLILTASCWL